MLNSKKLTALLVLSTSLVLGACNTDNSQSTTDDGETEEMTTEEDTSSDESSDHAEMEHDESGEIPEGIEEESNPTYPVDSEAVILADRKSTRLNSSHVSISYAVFCLKKKKERPRVD